MRDELSEPNHWRGGSTTRASRNNSWSTRRRSQERAKLAADAVDAALAEELAATPISKALASEDIVCDLSQQLELLEKQREQLQQMLARAQVK